MKRDLKNAINNINKQIKKLQQFDSPNLFDLTWQIQTCTYIAKYFGEESLQNKRIEEAPCRSSYSPDLTNFLNDCIEIIKDIGLYRKPKTNFLEMLPNWAATLLLTFVFIVGVAIGESKIISKSVNHKDTKNEELLHVPPTISPKPYSNSKP